MRLYYLCVLALIGNLSIKNFKSVKNVSLNCRRLNVFVGEPNTGKSNILESLGLISHNYYYRYSNLSEIVRLEDITNIFYDREIADPIIISFDGQTVEVRNVEGNFQVFHNEKAVSLYDMDGSFKGGQIVGTLSAFKFYRFSPTVKFQQTEFHQFLLPPSGPNLVQVLATHKELRSSIGSLFKKFGLKLVIRPSEGRIELQKEHEGIAVAYPYRTVSDTLRRLVFYITAIKTVQDSTVMLEEPESHAFPSYTRYLGELISADRSNQYFIATHNPYFLLALVEKAPKIDTAVYITYYDDHQTKVRSLALEEILTLESDVFFNLDKLLAGLPSAVH